MDADPPLSPDDLGRPLGRRAFIGVVGVGLTGLAWGGAGLRAASSATEAALPESVRAAVPVGDEWRIYAVNPPYPTFDPDTWSLTIDGLVDAPQRFTYAELRGLARTDQVSDFHCVTGWSVYDVKWGGVRLSDLIEIAQPKATARALSFDSMEDEYVDTLTMEQAASQDAMLAYDMQGSPLSREHGAPARVIMPRMYAYKGVKWMSRITFTADVKDGYWEQRGYDRDAWVGRSNGA